MLSFYSAHAYTTFLQQGCEALHSSGSDSAFSKPEGSPQGSLQES